MEDFECSMFSRLSRIKAEIERVDVEDKDSITITKPF